MGVGAAHYERAEAAHFLVEQADRVVVGIVAAKTVRADHFGEPVAVVGRGGVAATAHLGKANTKPRLGKLPRGFGPGQPAADDVNLMRHRRVR